jgi:hypothetical protein
MASWVPENELATDFEPLFEFRKQFLQGLWNVKEHGCKPILK